MTRRNLGFFDNPTVALVSMGSAALIAAVTLLSSWTSIEGGEVALKLNNLTGGMSTITTPGAVFKLPLIHSVYTFDVSPQTFEMSGDEVQNDLHVNKLTVRANDGANFSFDETQVIFQIMGEEIETVVSDAGLGNNYRNWVGPYVRTILRDEFGKESTVSVSSPTNSAEATVRAKAALNEALNSHGITVDQIVTPRPQFNEKYEDMIEARNHATNQLSVIESDLAKARTDRSRIISIVNRDQNKEYQGRKAKLEAELATATATQANARREADSYRIESVGEAQAHLSAKTREARELQGKLQADYRSEKAKIDAFKTQPVERVMQRLGEKLEGVTIDIQPWANDAHPQRVQMEELKLK